MKTFKFLHYPLVVSMVFIFVYYMEAIGDIILSPGDGINHFQIAKYSWNYPGLFFDHWGKPLFTLLSSPFAQFGFKGMIFFNICLFVVSSIFLVKISKKLTLKNEWLAIALCFAAPVYFRIVLSGLTEILFSTIVIVTLYFF